MFLSIWTTCQYILKSDFTSPSLFHLSRWPFWLLSACALRVLRWLYQNLHWPLVHILWSLLDYFLLFKNCQNVCIFVFLNVPLRKISRSRFISLRFHDFSYHPFLSVKPQNLLSIGQFSPHVCKLGLGLSTRALARLGLLPAWRGSPWPAWEHVQAWLSSHCFVISFVQINLARVSFHLLLFFKSKVS